MELIKQQDEFDCGVANCVMIINHLQKSKLSIEEFKIKHKYSRCEYTLDDVSSLLSKYNISSEYFKLNGIEELTKNESWPILMVIKNEDGFSHYVCIGDYDNGYFKIYDPDYSFPRYLSVKELTDISTLNIGMFRKITNYDLLKNSKNLIKYLRHIYRMINIGWKYFLINNLIVLMNMFLFFFANMFIKVMLNEFTFLDTTRMLKILVIFLCIISLWVCFKYLENIIDKKYKKKIILDYINAVFNNTNVSKSFSYFNEEIKINELTELLNFSNMIYFVLNNLVAFVLYTSIILWLISSISVVLLLGTLILMMLITVTKWYEVKSKQKNIYSNKNENVITNVYIKEFIMNLESIEKKVNIEKYIDLTKRKLKSKKIDFDFIWLGIEKVILYFYYTFMIFFLYKGNFEISTFIVITNIVLIYGNSLEKNLLNIISSFVINKNLLVINNFQNMKIKRLDKHLIITHRNKIVKNKWINVEAKTEVLINYEPLENYIDDFHTYESELNLLLNETVSNNLFNFGNNNGLDNYAKYEIGKLLESYDIDISKEAMHLNQEQKIVIQTISSLFTDKPIILIRKYELLFTNKELIKIIKTALKDKVVIYYEK